MLYSILDQKLQNDKELWYMIDGSFITNLPDTWALNQRYVLLAINQLTNTYRRVQLGGLTCDSQDYYNSETHSYQVFLPTIKPTRRRAAVHRLLPHRRLPGKPERLRRHQALPDSGAQARHHRPRPTAPSPIPFLPPSRKPTA